MSTFRATSLYQGFACLAAAALLSTSCAQAPPTPSAPAASSPSLVPNLFDTQRAIDEYIDSGRYQADFSAVVAQAGVWLEKRAPAVRKPAIVLDIDETSLSNWPAYRANRWALIVHGDCDLESGPCNLRKWQESGRAAALPSTLALAQRAGQLGVTVFFISGRPTSEQAATERNLREQGYRYERVILRPAGVFRSAVDFKAPARCKLEQDGYTILLALGDQQSDLDGGCAERGFKLPNPVYYLP
jgi:acid phosphatase